MKRWLKITLWVLAALLVLLGAALIAVQSPRVQTALAKRFISRLEASTDSKIEFNGISVKPFDAVHLDGLVILDPHPYRDVDTLFWAKNISATFSARGLFSGEGVYLNRIRISDGGLHLTLEPYDSTQLTNLERIFRLFENSGDGSVDWEGHIASASRLNIENFTFSLADYPQQERQAQSGVVLGPEVIDWTDFTLKTNISARGISAKDGIVKATVDNIDIHEIPSGTRLGGISGKVCVGHKKVRVDNLTVRDEFSNVEMSVFRMDGCVNRYKHFNDEIRLEGHIKEGSVLSMRTISHFGPNMEGISFRAQIDGTVKGYVNDIELDGIRFRDLDSGVSAKVDGSIVGLPSVTDCMLDMSVENLDFDMRGLQAFIGEWAPGQSVSGLDRYAAGQRFRFNGRVNGPFNRMAVNGNLGSGIGSASANLTLRNLLDKRRPLTIDGSLATNNLDVGRIIGNDKIHELTLQAAGQAVLAQGQPNVRIDSLKISRLNALDYDYSNISAVGTYSGDAFDGRIIAADPNLSFMFQGLFNLSRNTRNAAYRFYASLGYANLHELNLYPAGNATVRFQASSDFLRTEENDLIGDISLFGVALENDRGRYDIGDISLQAHANDNVHRIRLNSRMAEGSFVGEKSIFQMVTDLEDLIVGRHMDALLEDRPEPWSGTPYEVNFKVHNCQDLLNFFAQGIYVENGSTLRLSVGRDGLVSGSVRSGRLALGGNFIKDINLDLSTAGEALRTTLSGSTMNIAGMEFKDSRLQLYAAGNHIGAGYRFDNADDNLTHGELLLGADLARDRDGLAVNARVLPSNLYYQGSGWGISSGDIVIRKDQIDVASLVASHEDQQIVIDGGISATSRDTLGVNLRKMDISVFNSLIMKGGLSLEGLATGEAKLLSPMGNGVTPGLIAQVQCDSTMLSGRRVGQVELESIWNGATQAFDFLARNMLDGQRNFDISGSMVPSTKRLHAQGRLNGLELGYLEPVMEGVFSRFEGKVSGLVSADGPVSDLRLASDGLSLADGHLQLDYTQVDYLAQGDLALDSRALHFNVINLSDGEQGSGTVRGGILLGGFRDPGLDVHIQFDRMKVLDLEAGENPDVYGRLYGSGHVDVSGPFDNVLTVVDAVTVREGSLHIPLDGGKSVHRGNLLTFTEPEVEEIIDPYELMMAEGERRVRRKGDFTLRLTAHATPSVQAFIDIGEGNIISGTGSGLIEIESVQSQNSFVLNGDYTLNQGNFHFSAMGLVSRDFSIQDGSSIRFNGDVMDSDLDVSGLYTTKTSLASLISDESATNRRTVNCLIHITDKLRNPQVQFSIDIPDLNPVTQAQVDAALNTDDKVQKQFLYLLIAGNFLPGEDSGITTGGTDMLYSNISSIMAGQLNNIFEKLDIPVDLGLNYRANDQGNDLFDVALSTQLFMGRVIVNGNFGNKQLEGGTTTDEVAGDLDIEIKLDKSGALRLNLFSHSADQYSSYLDNSQRNGGGITYQREFNSLWQFFRDLFTSRRHREEQAVLEAMTPQQTVTLQIDSTGRAQPINE